MKAGESGLPLIGRPVFMITSRAKRSGISVAIGKPSSPPQSCQTSVMRFRSNCLTNDSQRVVMQRVGVHLASHGFVGTAEADQVGRDHATVLGQRGDHLAIQVAPRRLAVQAEDRIALPFVEVVHSQAGADFDIMRREGKAGQIGESLVGVRSAFIA